MNLLDLVLLFFLGIIVGFINIVSAGGSLITLPALIFFGLPSAVANGTNRIGILVQNLFAMIQFKKKGLLNWKLSILVSIPAIIGSIFGANFAIDLSEKVFNNTLAIIMLVLIVLMTFKPHTYLKIGESFIEKYKLPLLLVFFLVIGFYGGFIQAGVGFLIIIIFTVFMKKLSLAEMHSIKTVVITIYLLISTAIFIYNGQVNWLYALVLSVGSGIGGGLGGKFASQVSEKVLKAIMVSIVSILSVKLLIGN